MARPLDQSAENRRRPDPAVMRIGPGEQLVEQIQDRPRPVSQGDDLPQAGDLGVESRLAGLERILDAKRRPDGQRAEPQTALREPVPGLGQHRRDADRSQQRALAGHVRPADDQQPNVGGQRHVIRYTTIARQERMATARPLQTAVRPRPSPA